MCGQSVLASTYRRLSDIRLKCVRLPIHLMGSRLPVGVRTTQFRLWDARTGKDLHTLEGHMAIVWSVAFSPDGLTLASGSRDQTIRLWNVLTGRIRHILEGHTGDVESITFSPDEFILASASDDGSIRFWDAHTGEFLRTIYTQESRNVSAGAGLSPDVAIYARGNGSHSIRLWDTHTGEDLHTFQGHMHSVSSLVFSPDGYTKASGGGVYDSTIRLWDVHTRESLQTLQGHTNAVNSVVYSPDGLTLASGSWDGTIWLWDLRRATTWGNIKRKETVARTRQLLERSPSAAPLRSTETALLPNYPNPFNPETWIPYQLRKPAEVMLTIYDMNGQAIRMLAVGHQPAGVYQNRDRAAYWDGRNQRGETVASGVYFCTLTAGDFTATRKMLVGK